MRTFKLTVTEEELKAIIQNHVWFMTGENAEFTVERSSRIHDLTKRLNKKDNEQQQEPEEQSQQENPANAWT